MKNKYKVTIKGAEVDVYDILFAYEIVNPAIQHAVKKLLKAGNRGYKDKTQDYNEAIQSIERAKELEVYNESMKAIKLAKENKVLTYEDLRLKEMD